MFTRAFFNDPLLRWLYPDDDLYSRYFERFVYAYGGAPFPHGYGMTYDDGDGAVSLWHPSGYRPPYEDLHTCFTETVPEPRLTDVIAVVDEFARLHPKYPFRYQTFFARDPPSDRRAFPLLEALVRCSDEEELCIGGMSPPRPMWTTRRKSGPRYWASFNMEPHPCTTPCQGKYRSQVPARALSAAADHRPLKCR